MSLFLINVLVVDFPILLDVLQGTLVLLDFGAPIVYCTCNYCWLGTVEIVIMTLTERLFLSKVSVDSSDFLFAVHEFVVKIVLWTM